MTSLLTALNPEHPSSPSVSPPSKKPISKSQSDSSFAITFLLAGKKTMLKTSKPKTIKEIDALLRTKHSIAAGLTYYEGDTKLHPLHLVEKSTQIRVEQALVHTTIRTEAEILKQALISTQLLRTSARALADSLREVAGLPKCSDAFYRIEDRQVVEGVLNLSFGAKLEIVITIQSQQIDQEESSKIVVSKEKQICSISTQKVQAMRQLEKLVERETEIAKCDPEFEILKHRLRRSLLEETEQQNIEILNHLKQWIISKQE